MQTNIIGYLKNGKTVAVMFVGIGCITDFADAL